MEGIDVRDRRTFRAGNSFRRLTLARCRRLGRLARTFGKCLSGLCSGDTRLLFENCVHDFDRLARWSGAVRRPPSRATLESLIVMEYHRIEKGLSLASPQPGFGTSHLLGLLANLETYVGRYGWQEIPRIALADLCSYREFNAEYGIQIPEINRFLQEHGDVLRGARSMLPQATRRISREDVAKAAAMPFAEFISSRYSIRHFTGEPVSFEVIRRAIQLAIRTPSVCNRQGWRVHAYCDPGSKARVLACQNGNRGFADQVGAVVIVTCHLPSFVSAGERNQGWIDGGMFSMSLLYAFHSLGMGTCCLNAAFAYEEDLRLRKAAGLPDCESPVVMIAVGHLPAAFCVAASSRRSVEQILTIHDTGA